MRRLFFLVATLAAIYSAYWFVGSSQVESRAMAAIETLQARGWDIAYSDLSTSGFPSRFDTTVRDLTVESPNGQFAWAAPFVQVLALSYRPNKIIAIWPETQTLTVAGQPIEVAAQGLRASATFGLHADLPLDQAAIESGPASVNSGSGWSIGFDRLLAAIREAGSGLNIYDVFVEAEGLRPPSFSSDIELVRVDATVSLDAPLDRHLVAAPRLTSLLLREARIARGNVAVTLAGDLVPDAQGFLSGTLTLAADNWRGLLDLLETSGLLVYDQRAFVERALSELAAGTDRIEVPVVLRDGQVEALGVVLIEAPRVL